jgi:hypothetical protein
MAKKKSPSRAKKAGAKRRTTPVGKKKTRRRKTTGRNGLASATVASLHAELDRRLADLERRRSRLEAEIAEIDREIQACNGGARSSGSSGGGGRRPRNTMKLTDALHKLLNNRTMSVTEMSEAVQRAGYRTSSENFRTIVNQTLISNKRLFKRVARGQYTAK